MPITCLHHPRRLAAALLLLLGAGCAEESTDPIGPAESVEPALTTKGRKAPPTSDGRIFFAGNGDVLVALISTVGDVIQRPAPAFGAGRMAFTPRRGRGAPPAA